MSQVPSATQPETGTAYQAHTRVQGTSQSTAAQVAASGAVSGAGSHPHHSPLDWHQLWVPVGAQQVVGVGPGAVWAQGVDPVAPGAPGRTRTWARVVAGEGETAAGRGAGTVVEEAQTSPPLRGPGQRVW